MEIPDYLQCACSVGNYILTALTIQAMTLKMHSTDVVLTSPGRLHVPPLTKKTLCNDSQTMFFLVSCQAQMPSLPFCV